MHRNELEENWKRALADYKNLQKRVEEERVQFVTYANESLIRQLLPVLDNLQTMLKHSEDAGLGYIIKEFEQILTNTGVEEISVNIGDEFDADKMDAIDSENGQEVTEVYKKGYMFKNKLLRPATVKVGQHKKEREDK